MEHLVPVVDPMLRYSEMLHLKTFEERYEYLKTNGNVGEITFGSKRYLNQVFYRSAQWKWVRSQIIIRDNGCDLAVQDRVIPGKVYIHHINPITDDEIMRESYSLIDPENLVCVSHITHEAIHYGNSDLLIPDDIERFPNDTCPWKG